MQPYTRRVVEISVATGGQRLLTLFSTAATNSEELLAGLCDSEEVTALALEARMAGGSAAPTLLKEKIQKIT